MGYGDWFDQIPGAYQRNVGRMLKGVEITIGDDEHDLEERTVTIDRIVETVVGFDKDGIFAGVTVADTDDARWVLYNDGTIHTAVDDVQVGRHALTMSTIGEAA